MRLANGHGATHTVQASLNPVFYEPLVLSARMPVDLSLAPKITVSVFDSDPSPMGLDLISDTLKEHVPIGRALCPPGRHDRSIREYYNRPAAMVAPEWVELYDPAEADLDFEPHGAGRERRRPRPCGRLLCSFELRPANNLDGVGACGKASARAGRAALPRRAPAWGPPPAAALSP